MKPLLRVGRLAGALSLGALALGAGSLALGQVPPAPSTSSGPAAPASSRPTEEPPPAAAEVPSAVPAAPTPDAPPQELAPAPASAAPAARAPSPGKQPDEDLKPPPPPKRTLYNAAIVQALDKVTAQGLRFEIQVHRPVRYKGLIFILHTCEASAPGQLPSAFAHLEIDSQPVALPGRPANPAHLVFKGWMAADAPGLHPLEHPVYDAWLIACKTGSGPPSTGKR